MHDITDGKLQIAMLSRVDAVQLRKSHRICNRRRWDSFVYTTAGSVDYHMEDGHTVTVSAGNVLYLPLDISYTMDIHGEGTQYIVCDFVSTSPAPRKYFCFRAQNPHIYEKLFRQLELQFSYADVTSMAKSLSLLFQIYAQIVSEHHPSYISGASRKKIAAVHRYILSNLSDKKLSITLLAEKAQMSEVHFRRLFAEVYGIPPGKFIAGARISKAKSLMGLAEMRMEDIALQAGFSSLTYFCTAFKTATGLSPARYRQQFYPGITTDPGE